MRVSGELLGAEMINLIIVQLPVGANDFGLPQRRGAERRVGLPAVGTAQVAGCVEFGQQAFGSVQIPGGLTGDGLGDPATKGVVLIAGVLLVVDIDPAQTFGGVVAVMGLAGDAPFAVEMAGRGVAEGGEGVALTVLDKLMVGVVGSNTRLMGSAGPVMHGVVAVAFQRPAGGMSASKARSTRWF